MSDLPRIDVIIPAYKAQNTILRTLSSTCEQSIVDDLDVTIVNDCDNEGYEKFVEMFKPYMSIREIKLDKNKGPCCRQDGINATKNPLFTCIDADDCWSGCFALKTLRDQLLAEPQNVCCFSNFLEEQPNTYIQHPQDSVWMFGKLYKRDFIDRHRIKFKDGLNANEDNAWNMMCKLIANQNEQIKYIPDITYYWRWKEDSITRKDNANYSYNGSFCGYTEGMIYALKHAEKENPFNGAILLQKIQIMVNLYEYWIEGKHRDARYTEQNWNWCKEFYKEIYHEIKDKISEQIFSEVYNEVMRNCYAGNKLQGIVPEMGIQEFMQQMEKEYQEDSKKNKE